MNKKTSTKYSKYQDYVIKNGKIIGVFEQMYQDCKDPWFQLQSKDAKKTFFIGRWS